VLYYSFISFLEMQKWLISAWIRRKEIVNEEIAMYALTLIELLIFWNAKGYENFTHLLILCRRTEDV